MSMPSVELSSFLQPVMVIVITLSGMCQCPQSCFLHFYGYKKNQFGFIYYSVSMPSVVLSSFLPWQTPVNSCYRFIGVNALSRAFFISTNRSTFFGKTIYMCQCPQSCFLHFYPVESSGGKGAWVCQCPQSCFLHFYGSKNNLAKVNMLRVNALSRAFFISTVFKQVQMCISKCVNALSRAFFISTAVRITSPRSTCCVSMPSVVLSSFLPLGRQ